MNKEDINSIEEQQYSSPRLRSHSIDEVIAAGGAAALAEKTGKSWENLVSRLAKLPKDYFLTEEEENVD